MSEPATSDAAVRTARVTDAAAIGVVQAQTWRAAYADLLPADVLAALTPDRFARVWRASLGAPPSPRHRALVATQGARVVGLVAVVPLEGASAELVELDVLPECRRAGHGSRLLNAAVDTLVAGDVARVEAWPLERATQVRDFLVAAGFAPDGAWREREVGGQRVRESRLRAAIGAPAGSSAH